MKLSLKKNRSKKKRERESGLTNQGRGSRYNNSGPWCCFGQSEFVRGLIHGNGADGEGIN